MQRFWAARIDEPDACDFNGAASLQPKPLGAKGAPRPLADAPAGPLQSIFAAMCLDPPTV